MPRKSSSLLAFFLLTLVPFLLAQEQPALEIEGSGITTIKISLQDLSRMPPLKLDVREPHKGEMQHYEGVRVSDLLVKAGVPRDRAFDQVIANAHHNMRHHGAEHNFLDRVP
jgi:hypothetical protein